MGGWCIAGREGTLGCLLHWSPKFSYSLAYQLWGLVLNLSIYWPLSYPFSSLGLWSVCYKELQGVDNGEKIKRPPNSYISPLEAYLPVGKKSPYQHLSY